jgi:hypothetical protein
MGLVRFGNGVVQISGSIGGTVFARNSSGNYARARTKPVNTRTILQTNVRGYIGLLTQRWHDVVTATQRGAWATYAAAVNMKNKLGESIKISGFNHYIRVNTVRLQLGQSKCDAGPTTLSLPEKDPNFAVSASVVTQKLSIVWDDTLPWTDITASVLGVWMGRPQLATRNYFSGPWKKAGSIPGNQTSPTLVDAPMTLVLGQKVWVYGRVATGPTDSRLSEPMIAQCTVGA